MKHYWTKRYERVVDQRGFRLPPTWLAQSNTSSTADELGAAVHISGKERQVARRIAELLARAEKMAVVSTFLLADPDIEDSFMMAAKRGVRVYVMLASEARLDREESDAEFDQRMLSEHKEMLKRMAGHVLFRSASHFHAKVVVVDPWSNPKGILLTANLTREALERNEELAVDLSPDEARDAAKLLGWAMWETAEHEMVHPGDHFRAVKPIQSLDRPRVELPATTPESADLRQRAFDIINAAKKQLLVASFGWDVDHPLVQRLVERVQEGLDVIILARVRPAAMPALMRLREVGTTVYGFRWLHAKAIWSDGGEALVMSANLERHGLDRGFELGLNLRDVRAAELHKRLRTWETTAPWKLAQAPALGEVNGKAKAWHKSEFVELDVTPSLVVPLSEHRALSADDLNVKPPSLPSNGALPRPAHEVVYSWTVSAPILDPKAKEILRPSKNGKQSQSFEPPVFRERGRNVIAVDHPDALPAAKKLRDRISADAIVVRA